MTEERHSIKVNIFGNEYTIRGDANEAYIQSLAHYVNEKMKDIAGTTTLTSPLKISILAGINMADEIYRLRSHLKENHTDTLSSAGDAIDSSIAPEAIVALAKHIRAALEEE